MTKLSATALADYSLDPTTTPISARTLRGLGEKADYTRDAKLALIRLKHISGPEAFDVIDYDEAGSMEQKKREGYF